MNNCSASVLGKPEPGTALTKKKEQQSKKKEEKEAEEEKRMFRCT